MKINRLCLAAAVASLIAGSVAVAAQPAEPLSALSPENLAKPRPKAPFDLTGTWELQIRPQDGGFAFVPPLPKFKPEAKAMYEAGLKANAEGKSYMDDTGNCWPAGMPKIMTRVHPIQMIQTPTMIIMIQELMNSIRWIYLDGRDLPDPDTWVPTYNGFSRGKWEGDTLVIETTNMETSHHWVQQGVPVSDQFRIVERLKMSSGGKGFDLEFTLIDPVNWEGEWKNTKHYNWKSADLSQVICLPDTNENIIATKKTVREDAH